MKQANTIVDRNFLYEAAKENKDWQKKPMRYGNLTWVENDPENYDLEWWLDLLKKTHTDCITLSVGGIVAFYPTQVPLHYRSKWLGDRDLVGEFIMGARKLGVKIIARTDPHAVRQDICDAHPEWIAVDENGNKRRHWDNTELWVACTRGGYCFEHMNNVHKEIMEMYMPDAIFSNRWSGSGICYCDNCRKEFRDAYGLEIPPANLTDPLNPQRKAYNEWFEKKLFQIWDFWDTEIKKINPNAFFNPNMGWEVQQMMNLRVIGQKAERVNVDKQSRAGIQTPWIIGRYGKKFCSIFKDKPVAGGYSVGPEERYRWKDAVQSEAELRLFYADGLASGMHPSWGKFSGVLYDKRWVKPIIDMFQWHYENEKYLRNIKSLAKVGMIYFQQRDWYFDGDKDKFAGEDHALGMYHALVEARVPFDLVHNDMMDVENLLRYKLVILPNVAFMSEAQCNSIREYVKRGGSILATHETSLYDDKGKKLDNYGLWDLFGVKYVRTKPGPIKNSYINIESDPITGEFHPLVEGLEDAERIIHGAYQIEVEAIEKFSNPPVTLVPSYPSLPMEDCFPRYPRTAIPEAYLREVGNSRIIYFPWDIDRVFWEVLAYDHFKLLRNAFKWALNDNHVADVSGHGIVDLAVWEQENSMTVHVVNLTNPMMFKGPCRELIPLTGQKAGIHLPDGKKAMKVKFLVNGQDANAIISDGYVEVDLPGIKDHEIIAIDYE